MRKILILIAVATLPALASEPGQPLDCSDWVFLEPGLTCDYFYAPGHPACNPSGDSCEADESRVIDTQGGSMGAGFVVLAAARAAAEGKSLDEVVAETENMIPRIHFLFAVDTLEFLRRRGRISGAKALFGSALSIKPLLQFQDGTIKPHSQVRTKTESPQHAVRCRRRNVGGEKDGGSGCNRH